MNCNLEILFARLFMLFLALLLGASLSRAQTTVFTYQGRLNDGANPANGNYDFQFKIFDALANGSQQGSTITLNNVVVANGSFSVQLDFGANFPGATRFLEIAVKVAGGGSFTPLSPRQQITSTPYAIRSLNS